MMHTILLVDDDPLFIKLISPILSKEGYALLTAPDAEDAQLILNKHANVISVVLLDWEMPGMNGIDLLKWIRQQGEFEDIQVIMQTGRDNPEHIKEGIDAGAYFYLTKPVKKEVLLSTINAAIIDHIHQKELLDKLKLSENSFRLLEEGVFKYRTVSEGDFLAIRIANVCPVPEEAMFISELLSNAVEHGNLGITYDEKTILIEAGKLKEELERREKMPAYKERFVLVSVKKENDTFRVLIEDQGEGFDFQKYLQFDDTRIFDNHGRGIAISNSYLNMKYLGKGNKVEVTFPLKKD
jgi:DNA-binding response OmpR family regulator